MVCRHTRRACLLWVVAAMAIMGFHQRMAELWTIQRRRSLTVGETLELSHCLGANAKHCWKMAFQENLSLMASMTNDTEWQHELCRDIDQLEHPEKKKKP